VQGRRSGSRNRKGKKHLEKERRGGLGINGRKRRETLHRTHPVNNRSKGAATIAENFDKQNAEKPKNQKEKCWKKEKGRSQKGGNQ